MKPDEEIANKFLADRFGVVPTYEPLGKSTPPDFAIGNSGFEVRRLNQQYFHADGSSEGLEQLEIPLARAVHATLSAIPFAEDKGTVFWGLEFRRPLSENVRDVANELAAKAKSYYSAGVRTPTTFTTEDRNVTLEMIPASKSHSRSFIPGYRSDGDSGGMIGSIYPASIGFALKDKIEKTGAIKDRFDRWALILVDYIVGLAESDDIASLTGLSLGHYNAIAVIDYNCKLIFEWPENSLNLCKP